MQAPDLPPINGSHSRRFIYLDGGAAHSSSSSSPLVFIGVTKRDDNVLAHPRMPPFIPPIGKFHPALMDCSFLGGVLFGKFHP